MCGMLKRPSSNCNSDFVRFLCNVFDMIDSVTLISTLLLTYVQREIKDFFFYFINNDVTRIFCSLRQLARPKLKHASFVDALSYARARFS